MTHAIFRRQAPSDGSFATSAQSPLSAIGGKNQKLDTIYTISGDIDRLQAIPIASMFRFGGTSMPNSQQVIAFVTSVAFLVSSMGLDGCKNKESQAGQQAQAPTATYAMPTPDQLYQLVAPIALFPDNLVAIVLASSTYPDQISAAWQWMQQNGGLKGPQLMQSVDQRPWDASVKGLTQFSDVLQQMATNLSWTSSLGDAYFGALCA
jgi:Protein of unknown function (DUF3300)